MASVQNCDSYNYRLCSQNIFLVKYLKFAVYFVVVLFTNFSNYLAAKHYAVGYP
jgi:hypothetical protein